MRNTETPFHFDCEVDVFEKAGAAPDKVRRIGGFVSTGRHDKQNEYVLQQGLDFSPFLASGWFNDNHSKKTAGIVGFPEDARIISKGEKLPTGKVADRTGWYVEGYLLKGHPPSDELWNLAQALQPTSRRLGYSVEGKVIQRLEKGDGTKVVTRALVKNVAITACPVNTDTALEVLVKALGVGSPSAGGDPGAIPVGVGLTGSAQGAGRVLMPESLEDYGCKKPKKRKRKMTKSEAISLIRRRYPRITNQTAARVYAFAAQRAASSAA